MKFLVTGGAGFIGSNFVRRISRQNGQDNQVIVLDALTYSGNLENLKEVLGQENVHFVHGDIRNGSLVESLIEKSEICVNFAAESHVDRSIESPFQIADTNTMGTLNLLEAARKFSLAKFIQVSTDEVYGSISSGKWTEESPLEPNSPYSASKAASDLLVRAYHRTYGLNVNITRCTNNYGPFQFPEKLIPLFVTNLIQGKSVPIYGNGLNIRDWLHVDDHCLGIELVISKGVPGEVYNIGGGLEISNIDLTYLLLSQMGYGSEKIQHVEDRKGHDLRYSLSFEKISRELGYSPKVDFEKGFRETVEWYQANPEWWRPLVLKKEGGS
jgi:dTDP-glucose 4,6-dehydratase